MAGTVATSWRGVLADGDWWNAVWNTVRFAFLSVAIETVLGLLVALVLNAEFKGRGLVRAAILVPALVSSSQRSPLRVSFSPCWPR